jgi:hypothetical protein
MANLKPVIAARCFGLRSGLTPIPCDAIAGPIRGGIRCDIRVVLDHSNWGRVMFTRKWVVRVVVLVLACVVIGGAMTGCESTGGGRGSDGHAGHNH